MLNKRQRAMFRRVGAHVPGSAHYPDIEPDKKPEWIRICQYFNPLYKQSFARFEQEIPACLLARIR